MINQNLEKGRIDLRAAEITVAKLYVFLLPFRLIAPLSFLKSILGVCALYTVIVFYILGLILWFYNERGVLGTKDFSNSRLIKYIIALAIYLNLSSIMMSFVMQNEHGNLGSDDAFSGIIGMLVYFTQYALMFLYNMRVFEILKKETINSLLHKLCITLLVIGYIQVLVMNGVGGAIYDAIDVLDVVRNSDQLPKLCLTGSEGAAAGCTISMLVFPVLFSKTLTEEKNTKYIIEIILWLVPLFFTNSSTGYILAAIEFLIFFGLLIFEKGDIKNSFKIISIILILLLVGSIFWGWLGVLNSEMFEQIEYLLFEKATDSDNGSTVSRTVPLLVNWGAFMEHPIFGVGNGLQGYYYEKYFPSWAYNVAGSDVLVFLETSKTVISNGGVFLPSLLSGYGLAGVTLIAIFAIKCIQTIFYKKKYIGNFFYMYIFAGIAFLISGFQGDMYGKYYAWFMLSIPFVLCKESNESEVKSNGNIGAYTDNEQTGNSQKHIRQLF